ncbi:hypothetical protein PCIT_a1167 [Pseudoalteromonas citrea]|uniref:Uncharacterized protein n=2 Tax=Pseudoalteromonas citrea TaxID=43655 RepID=A0AAD4AM61_9GAMM|nr:hypothetical protein [Pseudoalteromonas citrea]KAF7775068.1 hypothetical protein PCIT_a1167 [Pseudoalteromonas citrea]
MKRSLRINTFLLGCITFSAFSAYANSEVESRIHNAISEYTPQQSVESFDYPYRCRELKSTAYESVNPNEVEIVDRFTVSQECGYKLQSFHVVRNDSGATFYVYLVDSSGTIVRSGRYGVSSYPRTGDYFWVVENKGGGDGRGRFKSETRHFR